MRVSEKMKVTLACVYLVVNVKRASKMGVTVWISAAGGTFNVICGYLSRKYHIEYNEMQFQVDKKMTELWGTHWYQYMFDTIGCDMEGIDESLSIEQLLEGNF